MKKSDHIEYRFGFRVDHLDHHPKQQKRSYYMGCANLETELTYEWYRRRTHHHKSSPVLYERDLKPFVLIAAAIIEYDPQEPPYQRYTIHIFGLREEDRERSRIPDNEYWQMLQRQAAEGRGPDIDQITPRNTWPAEAVMLNEIRSVATINASNPTLRKRIDVVNNNFHIHSNR